MREDLVTHGAGLDHARPADNARDAPAALPVGVLFTPERGRPAIRPAQFLRAIVGRVHDDRVVGDPEIVELLEEYSDVAVVLYHAVGIDAEPGDPLSTPS